MDHPAFAPGWRFSALDAVVLIIGGAGAALYARIDLWIGLSIALVVLHFFLFCNVLRMSRPLELLWSGLFAALAILATAAIMTWPIASGVSLLATVIVAMIEIRRPSYHGIAWRRINPKLPEWWSARDKEPSSAAT